MSSSDKRPEAESLSAAAKDAKDSVVGGATYVKDRVTAPASGEHSADKDIKGITEDKATEAKEHSKGVLESISDGFKYAGDRLTASPSGAKGSEAKESAKSSAEDAKNETKGFFGKTEDKAKDTYNKAGDKANETKKDVKSSYKETQQSIADQIATDPIEESKAHGLVPTDTETLKAARG